jgi:hypothetical protein
MEEVVSVQWSVVSETLTLITGHWPLTTDHWFFLLPAAFGATIRLLFEVDIHLRLR